MQNEATAKVDANEILDRFRRLRGGPAIDLALAPARGKAEKLSALKQKLDQLGNQLQEARAALAEKDELIERLNRQLGHAVDDCTRLEDDAAQREEDIVALEARASMSLDQYLEAAREQGELEAQLKDREHRLISLQDARVQAQHSRDMAMTRLFPEVARLGEPENEAMQQAIAETTAFLNGDASQSDKAARAYQTLDRLVVNHAAEVLAFDRLVQKWMSKELDDTRAKMDILKQYPKALDQINVVLKEDWLRDCWPQVRCHFRHLHALKDQMRLQAELASHAARAAIIALRRGSNTHVIHACIKTAYEAYAVMGALNSAACNVSYELEADLCRSTDAVERVLKRSGNPNASLEQAWSSDGDETHDNGPAPVVHDLPPEYFQSEEIRAWDSSPFIADSHEYGDYNTHYEDVIINPANALPMTGGGYGGVDIMGNPYGFNDY